MASSPQRRPAPWMWGRVGGDALDLACLGAALTSDNARPDRIAAAMEAVASVTALDVLCVSAAQPEDSRGRAGASSPASIQSGACRTCTDSGATSRIPRFPRSHLRSVRVDTARQSPRRARPRRHNRRVGSEITDDQARPPDRLALAGGWWTGARPVACALKKRLAGVVFRQGQHGVPPARWCSRHRGRDTLRRGPGAAHSRRPASLQTTSWKRARRLRL